MQTGPTTAPLAVAWLLQAFTQALPDVQVSDGFPNNPQRSWLMLGAINWDSEEWEQQGSRVRREVYDVMVGINCQLNSATYTDARSAVYAVLATVEELLRANPTMDGIVTVSSVQPRSLGGQPMPTNGGYEAQFIGNIRVEARK